MKLEYFELSQRKKKIPVYQEKSQLFYIQLKAIFAFITSIIIMLSSTDHNQLAIVPSGRENPP